MPLSLADGKVKVAVLSTRPANPSAPTVAELDAGIQASCRIASQDWNVGPAASETVDEKPLCREGNVQALGPSNFTAEFTVFRYFTEEGQPETGEDDTEEGIGDALYQAVKTKGARLYIYERETSRKSLADWAADDEVSGYEILLDNPQKPGDQGGYIKRRVVGLVQDAWLDAKVAAGTGG
jgi:hypothetical protein